MVDTVEAADLEAVRKSALSRAPISLGVRRTASPHEFYRYPARFPPELAASVIKSFSRAGDVVADYFVGGGTTLVEARRAGRLGVGSDINSLSVFVSQVKTRLYDEAELADVIAWSRRVNDHQPAMPPVGDADLAYFRNLITEDLADQRQLLLGGIAALDDVGSPKARALARCVLLRTAQWALDMRRDVPEPQKIERAVLDNAAAMVAAARTATKEYRRADKQAGGTGLPHCAVLHRGLPGVADDPRITKYPAPRLVLTSPPYPGVYVNYHRWKIRGRQETPFPYYLAGQEDGNGLAYYTMSARSDPSQRTYFEKLEAAFVDIARMCDAATHVVQVVGFNLVEDQLSRYLVAMQNAGFAEVKFAVLATASDGRLWRAVPGRRWWAHAGDRSEVATHTAHEVVLIHRLAR